MLPRQTCANTSDGHGGFGVGKKTIDAQSWAAGERVEFERTSAMGKEVESRKSKTGTRALPTLRSRADSILVAD